MSTETPKPSIAPWILFALALAAAAGMAGYALARKQITESTTMTVWNRFMQQDSRQRNLEAQIKDLEKTISELKAKQAKATPAPTAADPALTAQLNALAAALSSLTESQKAQQNALARLTAKPAPVASLATPAPTPTAAAPTPAPAPVAPASKPVVAAPSSVEAAYKEAWETGKPVLIGQVKNPQTGQMEGGRALDPGQAKVLGLASWQEWYATEEQARRAELETQAGKELERTENTLQDIPKNPPKPTR